MSRAPKRLFHGDPQLNHYEQNATKYDDLRNPKELDSTTVSGLGLLKDQGFYPPSIEGIIVLKETPRGEPGVYGTFFCKSYGFQQKKLSTFLKVSNFFQWHLSINLIDKYIGI